jgi:hypothetical protein
VVTPQPDGEQWRRTFDGSPLISTQRIDGSCVVERFGVVDIRFGLEAVDGALRYGFRSASMRFGRFAVPLPLIAAVQERARADGGLDVSVDVAMKWIGRIVAYDGALTRFEVER